jgi:mRNA interferase RelE/StbE
VNQPYRVEIHPAAQRDLRRFPASEAARLAAAIIRLEDAPRPMGSKKLRGSEQVHRLRVGRYRVIYEVLDAERRVVVTQVRRRTESTYSGL